MTVQRPLAPGKHKLRVEEYLLLADAGVFGDARTELIDGDIIVMSPEYRPHAYAREELAYRNQARSRVGGERSLSLRRQRGTG